MHDPMSVIFDILRPWPQKSPSGKRWRMSRRRERPRENETPWHLYRHRKWGPFNLRAARHRCFACEGTGKVPDPMPSWQAANAYGPGDRCPDCLGRGFTKNPWRRRPYFGWHFWQFGDRELYFPALITVWHVDPNAGGNDDSCRAAVRKRQLEAHHDGDKLGDWWWWKVFTHMHLWHVHHWKVQVVPWDRLQRWRKVRCPACGERFGWEESSLAPGFDMPGYHFRCAESHGFGVSAGEPEKAAAEP